MTPTEKDAMALAVLDVFASAPFLQICCGQAQGGGMDENGNGEPPSCCGQPIGGAEIADARAHLASRIAELEKIAALAKKAQWLHAACWDLSDGAGCFIPVDQMRRFDEVFNSLGRALGDIVPMDEDEERELFERPFARATRAEAELAAVLNFLRDDSLAATFQTLGQYRTAAIKAAREGK